VAVTSPRPLPAASELAARFGPLFNLIYVRSNSEGRVVAHFTLYNLIAWQAVLAKRGGPANLNLALASNPLEPSCWSDAVANELDVPFAWIDGPDRAGVLEATTARMNKALAVWRDRGTSQLVSHIVNQVFDRHRKTEDNQTSAESLLTEDIIDEIANELAHHMVGLPLERPMTAQDIARVRQCRGTKDRKPPG